MSNELSDYDPDALGRQIYLLRKTGVSFPDIQQRMLDEGIPAPSLDNLMKLHRSFQMKLAQTIGTDERKALLAMELDRLDDLQAAVWPQAMNGYTHAVKSVLDIMSMRAKFTGLDQLNAQDKNTLQSVLIVGGDTQSFIEALEYGRKKIVAGEDPDDDDDQEVP